LKCLNIKKKRKREKTLSVNTNVTSHSSFLPINQSSLSKREEEEEEENVVILIVQHRDDNEILDVARNSILFEDRSDTSILIIFLLVLGLEGILLILW
jgi:hypothetical protein